MFVLAANRREEDCLHLVGRQFGVVDTENELIGFNPFQEHGHAFVGLETHGQGCIPGIVFQFEDAFFLVVFHEEFDDKKGDSCKDERRDNGDYNDCCG